MEIRGSNPLGGATAVFRRTVPQAESSRSSRISRSSTTTLLDDDAAQLFSSFWRCCGDRLGERQEPAPAPHRTSRPDHRRAVHVMLFSLCLAPAGTRHHRCLPRRAASSVGRVVSGVVRAAWPGPELEGTSSRDFSSVRAPIDDLVGQDRSGDGREHARLERVGGTPPGPTADVRTAVVASIGTTLDMRLTAHLRAAGAPDEPRRT